MINQVFNEDCLEGMKSIDPESIDLLLTDPPYNISMKSNFNTMGRQGVDFGEWDKGFDQRSWLEVACGRVKQSGSAIIFNDYKNIGIMAEVLNSNGFDIKEMLIWKKPNPMPRNADRLYVTSIEIALWAVKGKGWTFNKQKKTYENAIFEVDSEKQEARFHPTQKPINLIAKLIKIHSDEKNVVLDCFMGSGTTAIACLETNRNYIGFEKDPTYFELLTNRIEEHGRQLVLF